MSTATNVNLPTGTWQIDPVHSEVGFVARHLVVTKVRGHFQSFSGTITVPDNPLEAKVTAEIDASSVDTGQPDRDNHLRSSDFFDVETFPTWTFTSTSITPEKGDEFTLRGELTMHGVTKPVEIALEFGGVTPDPWGGTRAAFSGETELNRKDFGLTWNAALETGGAVVGDKIKVELEIQAVLQQG